MAAAPPWRSRQACTWAPLPGGRAPLIAPPFSQGTPSRVPPLSHRPPRQPLPHTRPQPRAPGPRRRPARPPAALPPLTVVLVAPKSLENVGAAARAAGNYGAVRLAVAGPRFAWEEAAEEEGGGDEPRAAAPTATTHSPLYLPAARRVARGTSYRAGGGLLAGALVAPDLASLLPRLGPAWAVAVTRRAGRARGGRAWARPADLAAALAVPPGQLPPFHLALVFGREESGLTDAEVALCGGGCLALPTPPTSGHGSLNLGSAVAVALALLHEADAGSSSSSSSSPPAALPTLPPDAATPADIGALVARVSALAAAVGLAPGESSGAAHGRKRRSAGIARALLTRAGASRAECAGVHLLLRAVEQGLAESGL